MLTPDFLHGALAMFIICIIAHAGVLLRLHHIQGGSLLDEYNTGHREGYHACHGQMVIPLEIMLQKETGREIKWVPLDPTLPVGVRADGELVYAPQIRSDRQD